jgi:hypothetical protein
MSIVADAADGADGVMGSVLTHGRYPDCPHSQPPLAAEDNFNLKCAEEALCPSASSASSLTSAHKGGDDLRISGLF